MPSVNNGTTEHAVWTVGPQRTQCGQWDHRAPSVHSGTTEHPVWMTGPHSTQVLTLPFSHFRALSMPIWQLPTLSATGLSGKYQRLPGPLGHAVWATRAGHGCHLWRKGLILAHTAKPQSVIGGTQSRNSKQKPWSNTTYWSLFME